MQYFFLIAILIYKASKKCGEKHQKLESSLLLLV